MCDCDDDVEYCPACNAEMVYESRCPVCDPLEPPTPFTVWSGDLDQMNHLVVPERHNRRWRPSFRLLQERYGKMPWLAQRWLGRRKPEDL